MSRGAELDSNPHQSRMNFRCVQCGRKDLVNIFTGSFSFHTSYAIVDYRFYRLNSRVLNRSRYCNCIVRANDFQFTPIRYRVMFGTKFRRNRSSFRFNTLMHICYGRICIIRVAETGFVDPSAVLRWGHYLRKQGALT